MVAFKRAVVRALAPVATGTLLDPEIGAAQCHRRRVAARPGRAHRRDRGDRLRGSLDGPGQPGARGLERREGEAHGRVGGQAPRLLPPGGRRTPPTRRGSSADVAAACRARRSRAVRRAAVVLARRRREADRRGASRGRRRDRPAADRDRRRHPQGRVPVRRVGHRPRRAGAKPATSSTRRRACRGCCCPAASTTRRSRPRSRSPAGPARAASSPADRCGRRRRRSTRRARDAFLATTGRDRLRRLVELVDGGRPARGTSTRAPSHGAPSPAEGWYRDYAGERPARDQPRRPRHRRPRRRRDQPRHRHLGPRSRAALRRGRAGRGLGRR